MDVIRPRAKPHANPAAPNDKPMIAISRWTDTRTGIQEIFTARSDALVPNLKDMDLREAEETIRSVSLTLKVTGVGDVVLQRPQADSVVPVGSIVQVILSNE